MLIPIKAKLYGVRKGRLIPPDDLFDPNTHILILVIFVLEDAFVMGMYAPAEEMFFTLESDDVDETLDKIVEVPKDDPRTKAAADVAFHFRDTIYDGKADLLRARNLHA